MDNDVDQRLSKQKELHITLVTVKRMNAAPDVISHLYLRSVSLTNHMDVYREWHSETPLSLYKDSYTIRILYDQP